MKIGKWYQGKMGGYYIIDKNEKLIADFPKENYGGMIKARKEAEKELKRLLR